MLLRLPGRQAALNAFIVVCRRCGGAHDHNAQSSNSGFPAAGDERAKLAGRIGVDAGFQNRVGKLIEIAQALSVDQIPENGKVGINLAAPFVEQLPAACQKAGGRAGELVRGRGMRVHKVCRAASDAVSKRLEKCFRRVPSAFSGPFCHPALVLFVAQFVRVGSKLHCGFGVVCVKGIEQVLILAAQVCRAVKSRVPVCLVQIVLLLPPDAAGLCENIQAVTMRFFAFCSGGFAVCLVVLFACFNLFEHLRREHLAAAQILVIKCFSCLVVMVFLRGFVCLDIRVYLF